MPKRIPIKVARDVAKANGLRQVIILAFDDDGITHVVSYGKTVIDCEQAAIGANKMKEAMGWPAALCTAEPARVKKLMRENAELRREIARVAQAAGADLSGFAIIEKIEELKANIDGG